MDFLHRDRSNRVYVYHAAAALRIRSERRTNPTRMKEERNKASIALMISVVITRNRYNLARRANVYEESA